MTVFEQIEDGDEYAVDLRDRNLTIDLSCCDCGLTHTIEAERLDRDILRVKVSRNNRSTGAMRRWHKYPCKPRR